jgi:hypothetical protein
MIRSLCLAIQRIRTSTDSSPLHLTSAMLFPPSFNALAVCWSDEGLMGQLACGPRPSDVLNISSKILALKKDWHCLAPPSFPQPAMPCAGRKWADRIVIAGTLRFEMGEPARRSASKPSRSRSNLTEIDQCIDRISRFSVQGPSGVEGDPSIWYLADDEILGARLSLSSTTTAGVGCRLLLSVLFFSESCRTVAAAPLYPTGCL